MKYNKLAAALLPLYGPVALAQAGATPEELFVIGHRLEETIPQELGRFGNRLEMLTADDLALGGFNDLSQALQLEVPGLYVAPKNGPFDYVNCSLQGSRCEDVLWLVDGVRTNNRLYNTTSPLDTIPAHMIERVEVLYGGQGIFYGTQSVAGVVNVVTKSFSEEPSGSFGVGLDEHDGTHLTADYRFSVGDHRFALYASKDESDGFQPFADEDYQPSATDRERSYDVLSFGVKYAYDFTPESRLTLLYQRTDNELDNLLPYEVAVRNNARVEDWITAKWDYVVNDNVDLYVKAYWHDWDTKWDDIRNDLGPNGELLGTQTVEFLDTFWGFEDYGLTALADISSGGPLDFAVGYDYQRFWGNDEVWLIEDKTETAQAVYGQIRTSDALFDATRIAFGVRYNRTDGNADATVWNLSGRHDLSERLYLRGQIGTSFRLPDAEELYLRDCCERGNPNLEAEESENVEVGLGGSLAAAQGAQWQLVLFRREIDNLIAIDFDNPAFPDGIYANFDDTVEIEGWEAGVSFALSEALSVSLDYTSNEARREGTSEQIEDIPESLLKASLTYRGMRAPFEVNVALVNVGDVYDVVGSGIGRREHGGYTVIDLSGAYYLDAARRHRLGVRLENALDETYATSLGRGFRDLDGSPYPYQNLGAPRTLHATYSYRF
ncbi:MAG TPA: TonB-dependent receptor [Gammaproteobacteria bacterium]